ncbi:hypothetical protein NS319_19125 [Sphingomonas sanguinis]|uniref:Uncharacterized protein n=1 Tax=Sphingomonas sanguinis TaxID=33051 RepID=A0A147IWF0_9SPHN|nr:hypothetical protein NS319_19125 [Sphingomonas sanguinis]KTV00019.1 hypothetical protein SB4_08160 [Sphingomonas sanguinis]KTW16397.1 hypothetical protein NS258_03840 [Sphingomonas sanguinis]
MASAPTASTARPIRICRVTTIRRRQGERGLEERGRVDREDDARGMRRLANYRALDMTTSGRCLSAADRVMNRCCTRAKLLIF